jgi:two-component system, OmpR family, sensor histidine kinase VicK
MKKKKISPPVIRSNTRPELPHATVKEAVQKRIVPPDHSSIIPGIDVNELKHSLDLLKYALDYSEAIVETVRIPLIVLNKKLEVLTANRAFYDTFKLTPKETENKLVYKLNNSAWNISRLKILLEKILPANTHFDNYEVEIDLPHLGLRTILFNARRTYRQVNNTEAILLAFEDVTDRKQLEKQKDDFIGIVSHELKTPLTGIKAFSELLEKHLESSKDKRGKFFLSKMTNQMERLTQLMASFVNVYKIQNGKLALHKKNFHVDELIGSIVADFQYTTKKHAVINRAQSKMTIYADRERVAQVLVNLISNAIKYSPNANKVVISSARGTNNVIISVQDFGLGIAKEEQGKIFERFFRVKAKKDKNISGLGLGLYISYEIISQHKGKIWVESIEKKGSTFSFSLPLK